MKYRRKPAVVTAERFGGFYVTPYPAGVEVDQEAGPRCYVTIASGQKLYLENGDWVITDADGNRWVCESDAFTKLYEPAERPPIDDDNWPVIG